MRRTFLFLLMSCLTCTLIACANNGQNPRILVPFGSPLLALTHVQDDDAYEIDVVHGADALLAAFTSRSHDVIVAPISLGATIALGNDSYPLLATITWGNLYLATKDTSLETLDDLSGRNVILFGQQQVPDLITRLILDHNAIEPVITYVDSMQTASSMMLTDDERVALIAEPMLSIMRANAVDLLAFDLQEHYRSIVGHDYPQAGVFISRDLDRQTVEGLENDLINSITRVNENPFQSASLAVRLGFDADSKALADAIPGCHIAYVSASESVEAIERFLEFFPLSEHDRPNDSFYYD